jgi:hypothetical protein
VNVGVKEVVGVYVDVKVIEGEGIWVPMAAVVV